MDTDTSDIRELDNAGPPPSRRATPSPSTPWRSPTSSWSARSASSWTGSSGRSATAPGTCTPPPWSGPSSRPGSTATSGHRRHAHPDRGLPGTPHRRRIPLDPRRRPPGRPLAAGQYPPQPGPEPSGVAPEGGESMRISINVTNYDGAGLGDIARAADEAGVDTCGSPITSSRPTPTPPRWRDARGLHHPRLPRRGQRAGTPGRHGQRGHLPRARRCSSRR